MDLIKLLMETMQVDESQAKGGAGLVFNFLKEHLGEQGFATLAKVVPQAKAWIEQAPTEASEGGGGLFGAISGLASQFQMGQLGQFAELATGFQKLGIDPQLISQFVTTITGYIQGAGDKDVSDLVGTAFSGK